MELPNYLKGTPDEEPEKEEKGNKQQKNQSSDKNK